MNCQELFEKFEKLGGHIICDYRKKECDYYPQKITSQHSCTFSQNEIDDFLKKMLTDNTKKVSTLTNKDQIIYGHGITSYDEK